MATLRYLEEGPVEESKPKLRFVDEEPMEPIGATIGPAPSFTEKAGRAWQAFKERMKPTGLPVSDDPMVSIPSAFGAAMMEFDTPREMREKFSPFIGETEGQKGMRESRGSIEGPDVASTATIDQKGLIPGVIEQLSAIDPIKEWTQQFKAVPNKDDDWTTATGKAFRNVALDVGVGMLSPLGTAFPAAAERNVLIGGVPAAKGAMNAAGKVAAGALDPVYAAETQLLLPTLATTPFVAAAINDAARAQSDDRGEQQRIESELAALLGTLGTAAGLRSGPASSTKPSTQQFQKVRGFESPTAAIGKEGEAAAASLEAATGLEAPMTAGAKTGSPGISKFEGFVRKIGVGFSALPTVIEQKTLLLGKAVSDIIHGKAPKDLESTGKKVASELQAGEEALKTQTKGATDQALENISGETEGQLRGFTSSPEELTTTGDTVRDASKVVVDFNSNRAGRLYGERDAAITAALGDINQPFIAPANAAQEAKTILSEAAKKTAEKPTGVLGPDGEELTTTSREVMKDFLESFNTIKNISTWDTPQSIGEMTQARATIGEALGRLDKGDYQALGGGFNRSHLNRLYSSLTDDMNQAMEGLGPEVVKAHGEAEAAFKKGLGLQQQAPVIKKIINLPADGGLANTAEIVTHFAGGEGKLNDLLAIKELLPTPVYASLRRGIVDALQGNSTINTAKGAMVDLSELGKNFKGMSKEFKRELLGSDKAANALQSTLDSFEVAKKGRELLGGPTTVSSEAMARFLQDVQSVGSTKASRALQTAVELEKRRQTNYYNDITKDIKSGVLGNRNINAAEFVDYFVFNSDSPETVLNSLKQLSPKTRAEVQNAAAMRLFQNAQDLDAATIKQLFDGKAPVKNTKLIDALVTDEGRRATLDALIPDQSKKLIRDYLEYMKAVDQAYQQAGEQGLVAANAQLSGSPTAPLGMAARLMTGLGRIYVNRKIANVVFSKFGQGILTRLGRSEPVIPVGVAFEALTQRLHMDPDTARLAMGSYFPQPAIQRYFQLRDEVGQLMDGMSEEDQEAVRMGFPLPGL